jgi:hypothetical protein
VLTNIVLTVWAFFTGYLVWYVTSAKHDAPITVNDARVLWKMHKQNTNCAGHKCRRITCKSGKVLGFECECGYKYTQKRLIVSSLPKVND